MAKAKSDNGDSKKVNKSAAIREMVGQNPSASSKEIVSILGQRGIKVSPTLVYYIRSKLNQASRKEKRERIAAASAKTAAANPIEVVARLKVLARELGGIRYLKQLVDLLAE